MNAPMPGQPPYPGQPQQPQPGQPPMVHPQFAQQPYPQQPYSPQVRPYLPAPKPIQKNVVLTRILGLIPIVGWFMIVLVSLFAVFTEIVPRSTRATSTMNGFGRWMEQGRGLPLQHGTHAQTLGGSFPTLLLLLPVLILAILIVFNIWRRPLAILNALLGVLASLVALTFVLRPDFTAIVYTDRAARYIEANYTFHPGAGAYFNLAVCLVIVVSSIAVAIFASQEKPAPPVPPQPF